MPDFLLRRTPPLANDRILGLASGVLFPPDADIDPLAVAADPDGLAGLCQSIVGAIETANAGYFRFDLEGVIAEPDEPRRLTLRTGDRTWDHDLGLRPDHSTRKVVALLVLAAAGTGAQFRIEQTGGTIDVVPGLLAMFPSYCSVDVVGDDVELDVLAVHAFGPVFH